MVAKKDEKTSLGSKILNYVPWRIALTVAAFAIPIAGPIVGTVVGALGSVNKISCEPNERPNKVQKSHKNFSSLIKPGKNPSEV
ncbi:MAG: hypothetical protein LBE46_01755, partial [Wolbachia pipientis]|nr:hypothetical protein [Wolbachia pipientis]